MGFGRKALKKVAKALPSKRFSAKARGKMGFYREGLSKMGV